MLSKILFEFQSIKYAQLWNLALLPCLSFHNWSGLINIDTLKSCVFADVCIFALVIVGGESLQVVNGILTKLLDALWLPLEQSVLSYVSAFVLLDFNFQSCGEMWLQQQDYMLWNFWIQLLNVLYLDVVFVLLHFYDYALLSC